MRSLLSANFLRLKRSNTFWGSMGVCLGLGLLMAVDAFRGSQTNASYTNTLDAQIFKYAAFIGILAGELIPLFFGTEYSDGTIRNKIMVGCSRVAIYFANLLTSLAACIFCSAAYMLGCVALGAPLLGWFTISPVLLLTGLIGVLLMIAAFCAIFTFVTMNMSRKSISAVICLLVVIIMFVLAIYLDARLNAPEFIEGYTLSVDGQIVAAEPEPNPNYLRGTKREIYRFVYDLLPTGQSIQYCSLFLLDPDSLQYNGLLSTNFPRLMVISLALFVLFTGAGAALFRRKDLK